MNNKLPEGYTARPVKMEDLEEMVHLFNAHSQAFIGKPQCTVESVRPEWELPTLHLDRDTMAIFNPQGKPAGYTDFWDIEPHIRLNSWTVVDPAEWGRGLDAYLLDWDMARAAQSINLAPEGARVVLHQTIYSQDQTAADLFVSKGFKQERSFYQMEIAFEQPPQVSPPPDGIIIRSIRDEDEERAAIYAAFEAFQDHWGHVDEPVENYYQRQKHFMDNDPHYDPNYWLIALDGEEIAGMALNFKQTEEDPDMAWVGTLGVRQGWRKRGLGSALLRHSFDLFYENGIRKAGLMVDSGSLTGAVRLYERAGMHVSRKRNLYELELRPGKDLMTQTLAAEA